MASLNKPILNKPSEQTPAALQAGGSNRPFPQQNPLTHENVPAATVKKSTLRDDCANKALEFHESRAITAA